MEGAGLLWKVGEGSLPVECIRIVINTYVGRVLSPNWCPYSAPVLRGLLTLIYDIYFDASLLLLLSFFVIKR